MASTNPTAGSGSESDPSYFRCAFCGASERSTAVHYGTLGYPRCPVCQTHHGP